jgi:uncharacterized protein (TIRG00374 family)
MKLGWKGAIGIAISVLLIWFTLRGEDLGLILTTIAEGNLWLLLASIVVGTLGYLVRALRWKVILHPIEPDTALNSRFGAVSIGFMANNLLPARVGEFARAYAMGRFDTRVPVPGAFGSLVVERVLDGLVLAAFLVIPVFTPGFPELAPDSGFSVLVQGAATLIGVMIAALGALLLFPRPVVRLIEAVASLLPEGLERLVVDSVEAFLDSLAVVRSPRLLFAAFLWTAGFWLWHAGSFWLGMKAFGIETGFVSAVFTMAVVGFAVAIPAGPGFFGTFQVGAIFALQTVYGVASEPTQAFAWAYHLGGFFPITFIGLWYARSLGLSLGDVGRSEETVEEAVEAAHPELDESGA